MLERGTKEKVVRSTEVSRCLPLQGRELTQRDPKWTKWSLIWIAGPIFLGSNEYWVLTSVPWGEAREVQDQG